MEDEELFEPKKKLTPEEEAELIKRTAKKKPLNALVDATLVIEKLRVQSEVRQTHLLINGLNKLVEQSKLDKKSAEDIITAWKKSRSKKVIPTELPAENLFDPETDDLLLRIQNLEEYVDGRIGDLIQKHPAYPWFSRVKGIGRENIGKIVALVDIEEASTISALWRFCGYAVIDGKSERRGEGEKLHYNSQLRSMCWRMGVSLMRTQGKFYDYYSRQKETLVQRYTNSGRRIVPVTELPKTKSLKTGKMVRYETDELISEGHVHNQALRKMIKLFLACLWLKWREAEGLPVTKPYAIDKLEHNSFIDPEEMTDR